MIKIVIKFPKIIFLPPNFYHKMNIFKKNYYIHNKMIKT